MSGSQFPQNLIRLLFAHIFKKVIVAHHHWSRAATGQAFDKLDGKLAVVGCLRAVFMTVQPQTGAKVLMQLVGAAERAAKGARSAAPDRKSTRLNSSHTVISYAVF